MLKDRRGSRRAFTVEVKAGGRRSSPVIPSRAAEPAPATRAVAWPFAKPEPETPAIEPRRILLSLIEPEPKPVAAEPAPKRPGRPRKARAPVVEASAAPIAARVEASAPRAAPAPRAAARPVVRPGKALAPGERWKRRFRWIR